MKAKSTTQHIFNNVKKKCINKSNIKAKLYYLNLYLILCRIVYTKLHFLKKVFKLRSKLPTYNV